MGLPFLKTVPSPASVQRVKLCEKMCGRAATVFFVDPRNPGIEHGQCVVCARGIKDLPPHIDDIQASLQELVPTPSRLALQEIAELRETVDARHIELDARLKELESLSDKVAEQVKTELARIGLNVTLAEKAPRRKADKKKKPGRR